VCGIVCFRWRIIERFLADDAHEVKSCTYVVRTGEVEVVDILDFIRAGVLWAIWCV